MTSGRSSRYSFQPGQFPFPPEYPVPSPPPVHVEHPPAKMMTNSLFPGMAQSKPDFENHDPTVEVPYAFSSYTEAMKKCTRDNREFKVIVLENQMEIMLINDPEAVNACGALNLLAGSGLDPPGLHGLANLTLKWMMRASKAYPTDGQIHNFIKEHRGIIYSHTTLKTTEISFGLPAEELKETLERLASHLSDPLFQRQAAEKVVHEIDLDHRKFLKQENMSIKLLERNFFKPQDKMTHFKTGNRETLLVNPPKLGIDIHQEAVKFFDCYYSSNLMKMVILGNQGLPTLTEWAINTFSTIYNKIVPVPQLERIPLPADFNRQILVKSHQHTRSLVLLFPLFCQANGLATDVPDAPLPGESPNASGKDLSNGGVGSDNGHYPHHHNHHSSAMSDSDKNSVLESQSDLKSGRGEEDMYGKPRSRRSSLSSESIRSQLSTSTTAAPSSYANGSIHGRMPPMPPNMMNPMGFTPQQMAAMNMNMNMNMYNMQQMAAAMGAQGMFNFPGMPNPYMMQSGAGGFMGNPAYNPYAFNPSMAMAMGMNMAFMGGYGHPGMAAAGGGAQRAYNPHMANGGHHPHMMNGAGYPGMGGFMNHSGMLQDVSVGPTAAGYHSSTPQLDMHEEWAPALAYIRHLLELRTPGSIIHYLNKKGWGTYIHTSDIMDMDCDTPFFKLTISLTKVGFEAYEEVVRAVFQYMYMIRRAGIQHWLYDEIRSIAAIKFFMRAKYNDFDCPRFSDMMARDDLAPNMYVCDHAMYYQCNPDVIHQALACFHPKNFAVLVVSRDIESPGMSREMYYETKYQVTSLPLTLQMALANLKRNDKFFLPSKNPYVIERWENLESSGQPDKSISILSDTPQSRCWYFRTNHFTPPRSNIHIALQSPLSFKTPASSVRTKIMIKLLQERCKKLIDSSSSAGAASMFYSIDAGPDGIQISLEGFNEKNDLMLTNVFTALHDIKVDPYRLKFFIDEYILDLNCDSSQNSECPTMFIESALKGYVWPHDVQLNELRTITVSDISQFIQNYLNRTHVEMFVTGNATETEALDYLHLAERYMKRTSVLKVERYTNTSMHIPLGGRFLYRLRTKSQLAALPSPTGMGGMGNPTGLPSSNSSDEPSRIAYFVQVGDCSEARLRVYQDLVARVIHDKCLLSFMEQLNLTQMECQVLCKPNLPLGMVFSAAGRKDPMFLESGMELCLQTVKRHLLDMSPIVLEEHVEKLRQEKLTQAKGATSTQLWHGIIYECPSIYQAEELDILASINKSGLMEFFKRYFDKNTRYLTKLSVHVSAHDKMPMMDGQVFVKDVKILKTLLQNSEMPRLN
ncbi:metalloprotease [Dimargaris cristalligena]|nr:metalloprotease [Dimargaris cristalligena]